MKNLILLMLLAAPVFALDSASPAIEHGNGDTVDSIIMPVALDNANRYIFLDECNATNKSGGAAAVGCGSFLKNTDWIYGQIDASATPDFIDDTADAVDSDTGDITVYTTTNDDGHMICAPVKFNGYEMVASQGETGSPVYVYRYYNSSTMGVLPTVVTPGAWAAGKEYAAWHAPDNWAKGTTTAVNDDVTTDTSDHYCVQAVATTAPSQNVLGTSLNAMRLFKFAPAVSDDSWLYAHPPVPFKLRLGELPLCFFGTAHAANSCSIFSRERH